MLILSSIQKFYRKKRVIDTISSAEQKNESIVNIHRIDENNTGDYYCAPYQYFKELRKIKLDIYDYKSEDEKKGTYFINNICSNALIIGGGGLLNRKSFQPQMQLFERLSVQKKKTVLWGVGHNEKKSFSFSKIRSYNVDISKFGLAGVRDYSVKAEWVPCVSCMNSVFDTDYSQVQEIGIILHKRTVKNKVIVNKFKNYPVSSNTASLEELIGFIGCSEKIITDSYHAMYWAFLMGKKVVVIPNSSKFFDFKYKPLISTFDDALAQVNKASAYSGILEECREINKNFAAKVFDYLEC